MLKFKSLIFVFLGLMLTGCVVKNTPATFDKTKAAKARVDLALAYLNQRNFSQAKINLDKALNYSKNYYLPYAAMAYYHQVQGNQKQAQKFYQQAITLDNKQGDVKNNYAVFLCEQKKYPQAYQQFEQALATPDYYNQADTFENIALCALQQGNGERFEQAMHSLEKVAPERALALKKAH